MSVIEEVKIGCCEKGKRHIVFVENHNPTPEEEGVTGFAMFIDGGHCVEFGDWEEHMLIEFCPFCGRKTAEEVKTDA